MRMRSDVALPILGEAMLGNVASKSRAVAISSDVRAPSPFEARRKRGSRLQGDG